MSGLARPGTGRRDEGSPHHTGGRYQRRGVAQLGHLSGSVRTGCPDRGEPRSPAPACRLSTFRGCVLQTDEGQPVAFAYGYRSTPGQFYRSLLEAHLSAEDRAAWLDDCFEFVALGVIPAHRRRGYGRLLHHAVLQRAAERTAILTTEVSNRASRALYTGLGWQLLSPGFEPPGAAEPFVIMVKTLKTESFG